VGGHLKNTFCLTSGRLAYLSQHLGDLEDALGLEYFERSVQHFLKLLRVKPEAIAHDLHPDYLSTRLALALAEEWGAPLVGCQHHHAHIVSCLAEDGAEGPAVGVACDGTGYGEDGTVWGCEIMVSDLATYQRRATLRAIPLPGGAQAIKEPWRLAAVYLDEAFGRDEAWELPWLTERREAWAVLRQMVDRGFNCPRASSAGRLFDAVAALCGLGETVSYEAQGPMRLEAVADPAEPGTYESEMTRENDLWVMDPRPMIRQVVSDLQAKVAVSVVSARFHRGFVRMLAAAVERVAAEAGLREVALSGGTFQNERVLLGLREVLDGKGFTVHLHAAVPPNDGGLSLGQAVIGSRSL
jgi:hydrogenase maturation protein HypF